MAHKDLRGFLDVLEKEGQLIRMTDPVLPEPDISAILSARVATATGFCVSSFWLFINALLISARLIPFCFNSLILSTTHRFAVL